MVSWLPIAGWLVANSSRHLPSGRTAVQSCELTAALGDLSFRMGRFGHAYTCLSPRIFSISHCFKMSNFFIMKRQHMDGTSRVCPRLVPFDSIAQRQQVSGQSWELIQLQSHVLQSDIQMWQSLAVGVLMRHPHCRELSCPEGNRS